VAASEFFFAIDVTGVQSRDLLREVVARVLAQAGCGPDAASTIGEALHGAVTASLAGHDVCRVLFVGRRGRLEISASTSAGQIWQATELVG
jgi:hypothetical protein